MCGIVGILGKNNRPIDRHVLEAMTHTLSHRGPDGYGTHIFENIGLGHRRLSIIDLETGEQPMCNEDQTIWITYNGEIYNYRELRTQLQTDGHRFRTRSDTEVIIHAYEKWGDDCVTRFRGMFAFGIWDNREKRVFLARDHFGIKPLYYLETGDWFAFASEIQALKKIPGFPPTIDLQALDQYLWLQYIPAPLSIFSRVKKLPPAARMSISFDGKITFPEIYWEPRFAPEDNRDEKEWREEWKTVVEDSVRAHLVSDVPFGAFLSGGIDSAAVTAYMARVLDQPVKTFSIGFEEEEFNELPYAGIVSERWHTEHYEQVVTPDAVEILPDLVRHYGEPFGDSSALPTYYVCKFAGQYVPMVLSGDGGDEFFAGYRSYMKWMAFIHENESEANLGNWLTFIHYLPFPLRLSLWKPEFRHLAFLPLPLFEQEFEKTKDLAPCQKAQYMDIKTYLPFDILTKVDAAAMMHGLEVRTPLVDVKVAEFALRIPQQVNIKIEEKESWTGKQVPKAVLKKYYPPGFLTRPKQGFRCPLSRWFKEPNRLKDYLYDILLVPNARLRDFFEPEVIQRIVGGRSSHHQWLLLVLEEWLRQNAISGSGYGMEDPGTQHLSSAFFTPEKPSSIYTSSRKDRWDYILELATLYSQQGEYEKAENTFRRLSGYPPVPVELRAKAYYRLASLLKQSGKYHESEKWFHHALKESQDNMIQAGACFHLGELFLNTRREKQGREYFKKCLALNPHHKKAASYLDTLHEDHP